MTLDQELESAWANWNQVMRRIAALMLERDYSAALAEVETFLSHERIPELRSDALGFRAHFREKAGDLESAKQDLVTARLLVGPGYKKYVHELCLGDIAEKQQRVDDAISWYREALHTCLEGGGISAGDVLSRLLRVWDQQKPSSEDKKLCEEAAFRSWEVLGLPGQPDLTDLKRVVAAIKDGEANPPKSEAPHGE